MSVSLVERTTVETAAVTDTGVVRTLNEDSIAVASSDEPIRRDKGTLLVVADGLGGYNAGEIASSLVTKHLPELYFAGGGGSYLSDLVHAVQVCNGMVHDEGKKSAARRGMGTTLVAAVIVNQYAVFVHVGDSRGYLLRNGSVVHRTKDHSLRDTGLDVDGSNARNRFSHVLTRAIGPQAHVPIDSAVHHIVRGDVVVLCSDGFTDCISDGELSNVLCTYPSAEGAQVLIDLSRKRGGEDNISVVVAHIIEVCPGP